MSVHARTGVSLEPFQERFRQMEAVPPSGKGSTQPKDAATLIAERLGWREASGHLDSPRVRRALGLRPDPTYVRPIGGTLKRYPPRLRQTVTYEMALRLCDAMDLDPVDLDL